jgi:dipeptidyl aminopeptidase/acylaminoacyl peptidase
MRKMMLIASLAAIAAASLPVATLAAPAPSAAQGGPVSPEDIMGLTFASDAQISPDGKHIVYVTSPTISTLQPTRSAIWIVDTDGSSPARRLAVSGALDGSPHWSPDSKSVAFLSNRPNANGSGVPGFDFHPASGDPDRPTGAVPPPSDPSAKGEPSRQLWLIRIDGGEAQPLTAMPRDIRDFDWAPDGKSIAFLAPDPRTDQARADLAAKRDWTEADVEKDFTRVWTLDLATHHVHRLEVPGRDVTSLTWSPDGKRIALRAAATSGLNDFFYHSEIIVLDTATGATDKVFTGAYSGAQWSPDSKRLTFIAARDDAIGVRGWIADLATGKQQKIGEDFDGTIDHLAWSRDGRSLIAEALVHTKTSLYRVDAASGAISPLVPFDGEITGFSVANTGAIAFSANTPTHVADIWTVDHGKPHLLTDVNPQVKDWKLGSEREVSWKSSKDGRTIYGVLLTPPGYVPGTPTKTVLEGHGGPEGNWASGWQGAWADWGQMLATHGYVVLLPDPRGSDGQRDDFARAVRFDWGGGDYQDDLDGIASLVAQKYTDPARVGIGGWSYGGFMSAWAVTHGDTFKTAVIGAAPTDISVMGLATDTPDFVTGYYGNVPDGLAKMDASSSMRMVDKVHVPVLVLHGQDDRRVPVSLGIGFYRGVRLLGKPAELVTYPREPHWTYEYEHQLDIQHRVLDWYDKHL